MFNVLPAVFFFVAGLLMIAYKIDRQLLQKIETELGEKRARLGEA